MMLLLLLYKLLFMPRNAKFPPLCLIVINQLSGGIVIAITKVRAWESGDRNRYRYAKQIATRTQARALAIYKQKLVEKLSQGSNDHVWWKMTRSLSGLSKAKVGITDTG